MSKKTLKMIGIFMVVIGMGIFSWFVIDKALPGVLPPFPGGGGGGGSEPNYRVVCDAHLTWSVLGGTDLNGVNCFSDRKCGFLEGTKFTDDNGGSGYIEYSRVGGGIRQSVTLGLLNPERRYRTEFCTKQPSGTVTYVDERGFPDQTLQWSIS